DNYRQAFSQTPGLLVSELVNPSLLSVSSRGIGDPHETQNLLVLKDGIPFVLDMFGYPTVYYVPPFEAIDRLEFVRGGASLLYGPQPSGSLNYVTHLPQRDRPFGAFVQQTFGSHDLLSTYLSFDGTVDRVGYLGYFSRRSGETFREENGDFETLGGSFKLVFMPQDPTRLIFNFDAYSADSGEPGGLTFATGPRALNYNENRDATQNLFDRVRVERYQPSVTLEHEFQPGTLTTLTAYGGYVSRFSKRQQGTGFGLTPAGSSADNNVIQLQEFYTTGADARLRHDWNWGANTNTLTAGGTFFYSDSPFTVRRGNSPDADDGELRQDVDRESIYGALFAENKFTLGRLSVVPAARLELLEQRVDEKLNLGTGERLTPTSELSKERDFDAVPLFALGFEYDLGANSEAYFNVAQGYKPKTYTDVVPLGTNDTISENLEPGESLTYELGIRGTPQPWLTFDTSLFLIDYDNRFGRVGSNLQNVGRSINKGWDAAVEVDIVKAIDVACGSNHAETFGSFSLYANVELLDAEFVAGPLDGKEPQYAPDYLFRTGAIYRWRDRVKVALMGTMVDEHFADDGNSPNFRVPGYSVWDLTAEAKVYKDHVRVLAGINNLFNQDYYSRIRSNGIDPAARRNVYAGFSLAF
ncbi:MAG TPA: TonB-dependent receptor plug domain-containing protein, partial [Chthoniobacterales bacterium]|nr:TonB-dependent receptor plug domain-containing protein [Chthoniobacterales bacterium]